MSIQSVIKMVQNSRKSKNPSKQLMFFYLYTFMSLSKGKITTVDYAAGGCNNFKYNLSSEYYPVDLYFNFPLESGVNEKSLIYKNIKDIKIKNDFSICTETIGINGHFDVAFTIPTIINFLDNLNASGILVFNMGNYKKCYQHNLFDIDRLFQRLNVIHREKYGNLNFETNKFLSLLLGFLMFVFPALAKPKSEKDQKIIYVIEKVYE